MKEDDIFEEIARDISQRTVGIEENERNREYQNCLRVMAFPGNFLYLWRLFDRVMKLFPNIEYVIGTDLVDAESEIKTYKLTNVDAINNDVLLASYGDIKVNFYVLFEFKPFIFSTYCNLMEFCNQIIRNYNTKIDLNYRSLSYDYAYTTNAFIINSEKSSSSIKEIKYLSYSTFENELKYLINEYPFEKFTELKWNRIKNMLNDEILDELDKKIIQYISDHKPSTVATINWVVVQSVMKRQWCKRLNTKCDELKFVNKPLNVDGDIKMQIKEIEMLEFCKTRELGIDVPSISSTIVIEDSTCKRGNFYLIDDSLVCVMMIQEDSKEVIWTYYGWKINMKLPWFIFQTKLELTLSQCFGVNAYKRIYDSLIEELKIDNHEAI